MTVQPTSHILADEPGLSRDDNVHWRVYLSDDLRWGG